DLQPGADWDLGDYMHMEAHPVPDQQDEPASSSSPFDAREDEEPVRVTAKHKHKAGSSPKEPVRCGWEGCGRWFPRPTELNKHTRKDHLPPSIACDARDAVAFLGVPPCERMFYANKDMYRHVRNAHPWFAADPSSNIPPAGGRCPSCGEWIGRDDNLKRHVDEQHKDKQRGRLRRDG
ncbi:hypothetical protein LZ30DRAFT_602044, partial [Colletotrichum cereale]